MECLFIMLSSQERSYGGSEQSRVFRCWFRVVQSNVAYGEVQVLRVCLSDVVSSWDDEGMRSEEVRVKQVEEAIPISRAYRPRRDREWCWYAFRSIRATLKQRT